jgi:hypothetical protein
VRFGKHIDIEVSYKILRLEIKKLVLILHYLAWFQKGLFGSNFDKNTLGPLELISNCDLCITNITNLIGLPFSPVLLCADFTS